MVLKAIQSHIACRKCDSSDAATLYENVEDKSKFFKCFSCGKAYRFKGTSVEDLDNLSEIINKEIEQSKLTKDYVWFDFDKPYRGISPTTTKLYGVQRDSDGLIKFWYGAYDGKQLADKIKFLDKTFTVKHHVTKGFQASGLFGGHLFAPGSSKYLTVTEGEEDAMSAYELMGSKYPCVSLKNGADTKLTQDDYKYLESFDTIMFCGDSDEPGRKAAEKFASSFNKSKVRIVKLSLFKDTNDYYKEVARLVSEGKRSEAEALVKVFVKEWWAAKPFTPEGLVQGADTFDLVMSEADTQSVPYPWNGLNDLLHGIRTSELIVLTAGSGVGKTAVIRELSYHLFKNIPNVKIGCMFLEESLKRTVKDLMGIELNTNLRLPENVIESEKKKDAWNTLFNNDRWIFWDHFGSNDIDTVCNQVRFIANNFGAKYIFLDHISIIVSDGSNGDERKTLDAIMTKLRTLVQELDVCLFLVSHLRRSNDSTPHEEGGVTSLSQLRGSAGIGQLADIVIGLERNGQADNLIERNLTTLRILKNRFTGETGPACYLLWEKQRGRLKEIASLQDVQNLMEEEEKNFNKDLPKEEGI